jgi:UDP-N-acetylmuramoyl-L-alanyl-D-glutamate--2,6-diaminopimelate ligase
MGLTAAAGKQGNATEQEPAVHGLTLSCNAMHLERFIAALGPAEVVNAAPVEISDLAYDTRAVTPGALFFCVRGSHADGHAFAPTAAAAGAAALVVEHPVDVELPQLVVADSREAMAPCATLFFGDPTRELDVAGITGTNGKTTTAFLLHAILDSAGRGTGLLTNIERRVAGEEQPVGLNTPEAIDLQRLFRDMLDGGDSACVMEATSIAQAQGRLDGTRFAVLVFTNLTQDHLDFHGTMEEYFEAKCALFLQADRAVVNVADEYGRRLAAQLPTAVTFDAGSDALGGIALELRGGFNRLNAISAALAARSLGVDEEAIKRGIESVRGVPGRFEAIDEGQPFTVIVDYAHTPDSLDNVIRAARELGGGRLTVVFGAGGDRDRVKRPLMGRVVSELADRAILTSDNPRTEDPKAIAADVANGALGSFEVELDRRTAIELALAEAQAGEVVVLAGRGAEPEQELATGMIPFDDRKVAREILRRVTVR